ncbi:protein-ADP-ribose hydrolase [Treponema sp. OttesenSCG-928-L16]|nr:protein-ADP-ribose hydrolase [Treponema sp. OttesenSCG-928-L16]
MNQTDRLNYLIDYLLEERREAGKVSVPESFAEKRRLFRGLVNLRPPEPAGREFLAVQDEFLKAENVERGMVHAVGLPAVPAHGRISLWQGDICRLKIDAIVNAANSQLLGCFIPNHHCIDNAIHSAAGIQLREHCHKIMEAQGHEEPAGQAKVTPGYNLPTRYVIHTVGPIVPGELSAAEEQELSSCYTSCLAAAAELKIRSLAFCCISTGVFGFPQNRAAEIAVKTVTAFLDKHKTIEQVVFNVFTHEDYRIYQELLYG